MGRCGLGGLLGGDSTGGARFASAASRRASDAVRRPSFGLVLDRQHAQADGAAAGHRPFDRRADAQPEQRAAHRGQDRHLVRAAVGVPRVHQGQFALVAAGLVAEARGRVHGDHVAGHLRRLEHLGPGQFGRAAPRCRGRGRPAVRAAPRCARSPGATAAGAGGTGSWWFSKAERAARRARRPRGCWFARGWFANGDLRPTLALNRIAFNPGGDGLRGDAGAGPVASETASKRAMSGTSRRRGAAAVPELRGFAVRWRDGKIFVATVDKPIAATQHTRPAQQQVRVCPGGGIGRRTSFRC